MHGPDQVAAQQIVLWLFQPKRLPRPLSNKSFQDNLVLPALVEISRTNSFCETAWIVGDGPLPCPKKSAISMDVLGRNAGFGAIRKDCGFCMTKGGSMHKAWISETLWAKVAANRKSTLSIKSRGMAWHKGSNGFSMTAARTTKWFHLGTRDLRGGFWALSPRTHLATRG